MGVIHSWMIDHFSFSRILSQDPCNGRLSNGRLMLVTPIQA
jgi:hypothetical protein